MSEIIETAKATQEVAKTTRAGLEAPQQLGQFLSRVIAEPLEQTIGMVTDRLKFMRWEKQLRLRDRVEEIMTLRNVEQSRIVPPKLALPIIEHASLEENDELQDLWAHLLVTAMTDESADGIRSCFIDIAKELEVVDAHVLSYVHRQFERIQASMQTPNFSPSGIPIPAEEIQNALGLDQDRYEESLDNLFRFRCLSSFVESSEVMMCENGKSIFKTLSANFVYSRVCITALGAGFVAACLPSSD